MLLSECDGGSLGVLCYAVLRCAALCSAVGCDSDCDGDCRSVCAMQPVFRSEAAAAA